MRRPVLAALILLAGAGPGLAETSIPVTAPLKVLRSGQKVTFTAGVKGCRWTASAGVIDPVTGVFTAPEVTESATITVRASLQHKLVSGSGETTVVVLPGLDSVLRTLAEVLGPETLDAAPRPRLPFLDTETHTRFDPKAQVRRSQAPPPPAWPRQLVGYNLPVSFRWHPDLAHADGLLLSFRDGEDMVRLEGTGHTSQVIKVTGRIREATLETLQFDAKAGHWLSTLQEPELQVRGVVPFAGNSVAQPGHQDGWGLEARFRQPVGLTLLGDPERRTSTCVVADVLSHVLRTASPAGEVRTVWGKAGEPGFRDGAGAQARFRHPTFLAARPAGEDPNRWAFTRTFVVADSGNHAIRLVDDRGVVSTLAGTGHPGLVNADQGRQAQFHDPQGVAMDSQGNVFVADAGNHAIRKIDPQGRVTTLAGGGKAGHKDGIGPQASFRKLRGLTLVHPYDEGTLYVVDGNSVRRVTAQGEVTTILGQVDTPGYACYPWTEAAARWPLTRRPCLDSPCGIVSYRDSLYIADQGNHAVRLAQCVAHGQDTYGLLDTVAGSPGKGAIRWGLLRDGLPWMVTDEYATLKHPLGLTIDGQGGLYVATGPCLAHCSEVLIPRPPNPPAVELQGDPPRAGKPCDLMFRYESVIGPDGAVEPMEPVEPAQWWVEFEDAATRKPAAPTQTGHNPGRSVEPFRVTFDKPGRVIVRARFLDDQGFTTFEATILNVAP